MPWILVAEPEGRFAERARDGLAADGWQVETVATAEAARAATAKRVPDLVIANAELPGAAELLARFARRSGGNGAIALLPELGGGQEAARAADESLAKPFTDQDLRLLVRRLATTGRAHRAPAPAGEGEHRLTSQDLFGDVLAEMEAESAPPTQERPPAAAARPPVPPPGVATSGGGARRPPAGAPSVDRALEETLSGLLKEGRAKPAAPRKSDAGVDALLSRTLSGLDVGERAKRPAPAPAAPPPSTTPLPSEPPPRAASPSEASHPGRAEPPPVERTPPAAPAVDRLLASVQPPPAPETKRGSRELDLSQLDVLAHPKPKDKPVEAFSTQRVALPTALRGKAAATEFGQYTLLERIAVGGMAEVWKARMKGVEGFQKTVAIKKILSHLTDSSDFVTMFIDEAKLAAQLNHNNIIHIYDLGKLGDDYYIAMEFVDGRDLRTILNTAREKSQPLPLGLALLVTSRLASALDYAHRKKDFEGRELGLVHRDVSPQNVLISFEGDIKLCDFGIVKAVSKASKTQMGALKGKLQYMSPEQAWGRPVDARSDIFSLGSLLFELLTGRRLFAGESEMSVLDAVREGRIQAPRDLDPRLPLEVNALVLKALAKEPGDRFESAGAMQRDLDAILASLKPPPTAQELANYVKRLFGAEARVEEPVRAAPTPTVAPVAPVPPPPPAKAVPSEPPRAAPATVAAAPVRPASGRDPALEPAAPGRNLLWLAAAAVVVLSVVGYFVFGRRGAEPAAPADATAAEAAPGATVPAPGEPQPAAPAEPAAAPAADVGKIVDEELRRREAELKKQYEESLRKKQTEVAAATPPPAAATPPAAQPAVETAPEPAAPAATAPVPEPTAEPDASAPATTEPAPATTAAEPQPEPAPVTPAPAPAPPKPSVQEGDLVRPGAGVKPPVLVSFTKPEYPPIARRMKVEGTVVLSLLVDERGGVLEVKLERGIQQNVGINEAAQAAARSAKFQPAMKDGVRVKMWYQLTIPFKL